MVDTECTTELVGTVDPAASDLIEKANAGAALAYAIYHSPADVVGNLPDSLLRAYTRACEAYGIGFHRAED